MKLFKFAKDESGAVTVDWVVLTAAVVLMGAGVVSTVGTALTSKGSTITGNISDGA